MRDRVLIELADHRQDMVDPPGAAQLPVAAPTARHRHRAQHQHEPRQLPSRPHQIAPRRGRPVQEQRELAGVEARRRFRAIRAEPQITQEPIRRRDQLVPLIDDGPVGQTTRQNHPQRGQAGTSRRTAATATEGRTPLTPPPYGPERTRERGPAGGAPADDPPARPSGPSLPARRRATPPTAGHVGNTPRKLSPNKPENPPADTVRSTPPTA